MNSARFLIWFLASTLTAMVQGQYIPAKLPEAVLFTIENGLSQTSVNLSFIDSYGFLWIGTRDGLNRYDGYEFLEYKHKPFDHASLSQNNIRCMAEDREGRLWIGTNDGLNLFDRHTGTFSQYFHSHDDSLGLTDNVIISVMADRSGYIWIKTPGHLDHLEPETGKIEHFRHYVNTFNISSENQTTQLIEDRNGMIWFGSNDGLFSFNPSTHTFTHFYNSQTDPESLSDNVVLSVFEDSDGQLWVGTRNGLNRMNPSANTFQRFLYSGNTAEDQRQYAIYSISEPDKGRFWLGSSNGIILFNNNDPAVEFITSLMVSKTLISVGQVSGITRDPSGIIWVSGVQGLFKIDTKPKKFRSYHTSLNSYPGLSGDMVSCLYKENDQQIWVGVWDKGLNILNRLTGEVDLYTSNPEDKARKISSNRVRCILEDHQGRVWLGSMNGLDIFDPASRRFVPFQELYPSVSANILNSRKVICLSEDRRGDIWIGTDRGVLRFQRKFEMLTLYNKIYSEQNTAELGVVFSLACDKANRIWIGTQNGLAGYDMENDFFYWYDETGLKGDISSGIVYSLHIDYNNTLWVGTAAGLNRFVPGRELFEAFTVNDGLANDLINSILEDDRQCLWLGTNKGISKYDTRNGMIINYEPSEGLQSYEFNHSVAYRAKDGEMFFGGIGGFNSFYPENLPVNPHIPEIVVTSFETIESNPDIRIYSGNKTLETRVRDRQSFIIRFAALDFTLPESNSFEYSLVMRDNTEEWIPIGNQHSLTFQNLPQGIYTLKIRGSNNDKVWNSKGVQMTITSFAPAWRTRLAFYIYGFLAIVLIYFLIETQTRSLRRSNRILRDRDIASREVSRQKDLLSLRNKNIEDSINYAQRIQKAMLTTPRQFCAILPDSFILHKPKDIVSGDFYWIAEQGGKIFVAAADCTGHGVPGAFMSIISLELFRKIIKNQKIYDPAVILNTLNSNFQEIFGNVEEVAIHDGMDLSFCVFDKSMQKLEFAGAFSPLYIVRDNSLIELKGDHFPIGANSAELVTDKSFQNYPFELMQGDMIYMFSDGYVD